MSLVWFDSIYQGLEKPWFHMVFYSLFAQEMSRFPCYKSRIPIVMIPKFIVMFVSLLRGTNDKILVSHIIINNYYALPCCFILLYT